MLIQSILSIEIGWAVRYKNFFGSMNFLMVPQYERRTHCLCSKSVIVLFHNNFSLTMFFLVQCTVKQCSNNNLINKFDKLFIFSYFSLLFYYEYYTQLNVNCLPNANHLIWKI